jgi:hypothetical protein
VGSCMEHTAVWSALGLSPVVYWRAGMKLRSAFELLLNRFRIAFELLSHCFRIAFAVLIYRFCSAFASLL